MYQEVPKRRRQDGLTRCIVIRLDYIAVIVIFVIAVLVTWITLFLLDSFGGYMENY